MAKTGGRNSWIAWPAALLCAAVVAALGWLSQPILPASVLWVGDMLRAASTPPLALPASPLLATVAQEPGDVDCRALYPDDLWAELTWTPHVLLSQNYTPPPTSVTALTDALSPTVRISCHWRTDQGGLIVTTLATVPAGAGAIADAALRGQGFSCTTDADSVACARTAGEVTEEHVFRGGLWLSSAETAWSPTAYGARIAAHVWG